jgi:7-cyano-7-deazaguanine synthase
MLALATSEQYEVYALTFRYGQRHEHEVEAARQIAARYRVARHVVMDIDLRSLGGSSLTGSSKVPKDRSTQRIASEIPSTYVPARNTIFLSFALAWAEVLGAREIFIGVNAIDYSGYPDCRPEFLSAFENLATFATRSGVEGDTRFHIRAPLVDLSKREIIQLGSELGVDYSGTTTCYDPDATGAACGRCDACTLRLRGFAEGGLADPARYVAPPGGSR